MARAAALYWNRCDDEAWAELNAVDLDHPHFQDLEGVYLIWHGGPAPQPVRVGQGSIRERLAYHRADPSVQAFAGQTLFVSWARAEKLLRDGIERYLVEALKPKVASPPPEAAIIEVNLPGQPPPQALPPAPAEATKPRQKWLDIVTRTDKAGLTAGDVVEPGKIPEPLTATFDIAKAPPAKPAGPEVEIVPNYPNAPQAPQAAAAPKPKRVTRLQAEFDKLIAERDQKPKAGFFGGSSPKPKQDETFVPQVMQLILNEAVAIGASDIHLEPQKDHLRVRLRVDGILDEFLEVPHALDIRLVSYIRVACGLDPEKGVGMAKPEDGRMATVVGGKEADLRLSTFPTPHGDKAVLRVIPRTVTVPKLEELGLRPEGVRTLDELIRRPQGMIIVTGPTGSGKSTTLYTILQTLNEKSRNIVTLEDPIEKKIPGISQGLLAQKIGFTFSEGLRAILRQDPNIIMVGEIRDTETAEIALSAALTGHMLFTTLHTNSALGAVTRLLDMGLEPFLIASALTALCAQRLARKVCATCREPYEPPRSELAQLDELSKRSGAPIPPGARAKLWRGRGCADCRETGYAGRLLLFETVRLSPGLRQLILRKASVDEMREAALKEGAELLLTDGLKKAADGLTTLEELARVVGAED